MLERILGADAVDATSIALAAVCASSCDDAAASKSRTDDSGAAGAPTAYCARVCMPGEFEGDDIVDAVRSGSAVEECKLVGANLEIIASAGGEGKSDDGSSFAVWQVCFRCQLIQLSMTVGKVEAGTIGKRLRSVFSATNRSYCCCSLAYRVDIVVQSCICKHRTLGNSTIQ
jgi:hypothetical protein